MSAITLDQLIRIAPNCKNRASTFIDPLNATMEEFQINTRFRQAAFLGQVLHESGDLVYVRELASGEAYEGRADLGNNVAGDGKLYKGRGLIQITGRANYTALMLALDIDCLSNPAVLEQPINACRSAGWFWDTHGLNHLADMGTTAAMTAITRRVNGGLTGLANRLGYYTTALHVLPI